MFYVLCKFIETSHIINMSNLYLSAYKSEDQTEQHKYQINKYIYISILLCCILYINNKHVHILCICIIVYIRRMKTFNIKLLIYIQFSLM